MPWERSLGCTAGTGFIYAIALSSCSDREPRVSSVVSMGSDFSIVFGRRWIGGGVLMRVLGDVFLEALLIINVQYLVINDLGLGSGQGW